MLRKAAIGCAVVALLLAGLLWFRRDAIFPRPLPPATGVVAWPMDGQNAQRTSRSPYLGPRQPKLVWQRRVPALFDRENFSMGTPGVEEAVIIGDRGSLYVAYGGGSLGRLQTDGKVRWRKQADRYPVHCPAILPDGAVVYGYTGMFRGPSEVVCYEPDGRERWKYAPPSFSLSSNPVVGGDGTVYLASGGQPGGIVALDSAGRQLWECPTEAGFTRDIALSRNGEVYAVWQDFVYCISGAGKLLWKTKTSFGPGSGGGPAVCDDGRIVFVAEAGRMTQKLPSYKLVSLDPAGKELWAVKVPEESDTPAIAPDGTALLTFDNNMGLVIAYDPQGKEAWRYQTGDDAWASPLIDAGGTIYVNAAHSLVALTSQGKLLWNFPSDLDPWTAPTLGADGTLYLGTSLGVVFALHD